MDKRYIILGGNGGGGSAEGAVRYDETQTLTSEQQAQARDNIGAGTSDFSGNYNDLSNKPTIPAAPVQSDWNEADNTSLAYIQNKPSIPVLPSYTTETWTFTLSDSTTITRTVYIVPVV